MTLVPVTEELNDKLLELGKNVFESFVPGGVPAVKILESLIGIPIEKRREALIKDMCEAINRILSAGFVLEQLQNDEDFTEFLLQAARISSLTFKEEKRIALKNAIYNSVVQTNRPVFEMQQIFLSYIEIFTAAHLKILHFLIEPRDWFKLNGIDIPRTGVGGIVTVRQALSKAYSELEGQRELVDSIWTDLYSRDLLDGSKSLLDRTPTLPSRQNLIDTLLPPWDALEGRGTPLGKQFVDFISESLSAKP